MKCAVAKECGDRSILDYIISQNIIKYYQTNNFRFRQLMITCFMRELLGITQNLTIELKKKSVHDTIFKGKKFFFKWFLDLKRRDRQGTRARCFM